MSTHTTHRENHPLPSGAGALAIAQRGGAEQPPLPNEPVLHVMSRDDYRSMTPSQTVDPLITTMRMVGRTVRLLFSRQEPDRAHALAMELARSTSPCSGLDDPVRNWEPALQLDRGLGRARRLQRLVNSLVWQGDTPRSGTTSTDSTADYLFATVMNLTHQTPLCDEALLFRLWYLAMRAADPPENATRLFGKLRQLPAHQQLAAGARMLAIVGTGEPTKTPPRRQIQPPHAVALRLPTRQALDCRLDDH